ncbi:MAG: aspartate aminotransferase family protein [bacterium]
MSYVRKPRSARETALVEDANRLIPTGLRSTSIRNELMFVVQRAEGPRLWDLSGNEYVDYLLGSGPMVLGHAHPAVTAAVRDRLAGGTTYLILSEPPVELARRIVARVPCAEQVLFQCSGTDATGYAVRIARAYTGRTKVLKFEGAYHGMGEWSLMSNQWTHELPDYPRAVPNSDGIPDTTREQVLIAPWNDLDAAVRILEQHRDDVACVIVEPLQRTFPPRPGFLAGLRDVTRALDVPFVFDEVVTGFRLALGGAQERYGVVPDLCALGKSISGGHPIGVLCGAERYMRFANPLRKFAGEPYVMASGTFSANPISATAALACLTELEKPGVYARIESTGRRLMEGLREAFADVGVPVQVTGEPSCFEAWFTDQPVHDHRSSLAADVFKRMRFTELLLERGVVKAHEKFFVSAAHGEREIEHTLWAFRDVARALATE